MSKEIPHASSILLKPFDSTLIEEISRQHMKSDLSPRYGVVGTSAKIAKAAGKQKLSGNGARYG
jgi:hypothetical protein